MNLFENGERNRSTLEAPVASHHHHTSSLIFSLQSSSLSLSIFPPPPLSTSLPPLVSRQSTLPLPHRYSVHLRQDKLARKDDRRSIGCPAARTHTITTGDLHQPRNAPSQPAASTWLELANRPPCPLCPAPALWPGQNLHRLPAALTLPALKRPPPARCHLLAGAGKPPTLSPVSCACPVIGCLQP